MNGKVRLLLFIILLLFQSSCSYDTKVRCGYRWYHKMTMKKLIEKCNYIEYGDTWVKKDI